MWTAVDNPATSLAVCTKDRWLSVETRCGYMCTDDGFSSRFSLSFWTFFLWRKGSFPHRLWTSCGLLRTPTYLYERPQPVARRLLAKCRSQATFTRPQRA